MKWFYKYRGWVYEHTSDEFYENHPILFGFLTGEFRYHLWNDGWRKRYYNAEALFMNKQYEVITGHKYLDWDNLQHPEFDHKKVKTFYDYACAYKDCEKPNGWLYEGFKFTTKEQIQKLYNYFEKIAILSGSSNGMETEMEKIWGWTNLNIGFPCTDEIYKTKAAINIKKHPIKVIFYSWLVGNWNFFEWFFDWFKIKVLKKDVKPEDFSESYWFLIPEDEKKVYYKQMEENYDSRRNG